MKGISLFVFLLLALAGCGGGGSSSVSAHGTSKMVFASGSGLPIKGLTLTLTYPSNVAFSADPIHIADENGIPITNASILTDTKTTPGTLYLVIANLDTTSPDSALTSGAKVTVSIDMDIKSGSVDQSNFKVTNVIIVDTLGNQTTFPTVDYTVLIS
jgi:hypothetical protein